MKIVRPIVRDLMLYVLKCQGAPVRTRTQVQKGFEKLYNGRVARAPWKKPWLVASVSYESEFPLQTEYLFQGKATAAVGHRFRRECTNNSNYNSTAKNNATIQYFWCLPTLESNRLFLSNCLFSNLLCASGDSYLQSSGLGLQSSYDQYKAK